MKLLDQKRHYVFDMAFYFLLKMNKTDLCTINHLY